MPAGNPGGSALSTSETTGLEGVILGSAGLHIAQRGTAPPPDAPALRVRDVRAVRLPERAATEARRTDGVIWRRHWLDEGRMVIEFVDLAIVEVHTAKGDVIFDRALPAEMEQHLLFDHVLPLALAARGQLVMHGGLISLDGRGVVLVGASGAGKSTLTAFAWQRGWTVGGDDGAVLSMTDPPTVQPTYATMRLTQRSAGLLRMDPALGSSVVGKLRISGIATRSFRLEPVALSLIAVLAPAAAGTEARFERLDGMTAHAKLFGSTFHAELSNSRLLPEIVDRLASIVETAPVGSLSVPRGLDGLAGAERILRAELDQTP